MAKKYVYHYHATRQESAVKTAHLDGIIVREKMFSGDWEEYQKLKEEINGESRLGLTIRSLTLIGEDR